MRSIEGDANIGSAEFHATVSEAVAEQTDPRIESVTELLATEYSEYLRLFIGHNVDDENGVLERGIVSGMEIAIKALVPDQAKTIIETGKSRGSHKYWQNRHLEEQRRRDANDL